jgi:hypothetical protein
MNPNPAPTMNAFYVRRHRARAAAGVRVGRIEYDVVRVSERLKAGKLLDPWCDDPEQIDRAIERMLEIFSAEDQRL